MAGPGVDGVTTALIGNCGVTFAPVSKPNHRLLAELMEAVEDIAADAIMDGLPWNWTSYGEYLDAVDALQPAIQSIRSSVDGGDFNMISILEKAVEAAGFFKKVIETYSQPELKNAAIYRLGWSRMQKDKWQEASKTFNLVEKSSRLYPSASDLSEKALMGEDLPHKSPTTAGVLAIVPGLGHVYTERYKDGMVAFLLNGLTIWAK